MLQCLRIQQIRRRLRATIHATAQAIMLAATLTLSAGAWAHVHPVTQTPTENATVSAPASVRIVFDAALEGAFSRLTVTDVNGKRVTEAKAELDATRKILSLTLPPLPAGEYRVNWVAVASDGHRTQGQYRFHIQ